MLYVGLYQQFLKKTENISSVTKLRSRALFFLPQVSLYSCWVALYSCCFLSYCFVLFRVLLVFCRIVSCFIRVVSRCLVLFSCSFLD